MKNIALAVYCIIALTACQKNNTKSDSNSPFAQDKKFVLNVGTLHGNQTYITNAQGSSGFDYELASRFAKSLGLKLNMQTYSSINLLYQAMQQGKIDLIAAGLTENNYRQKHFKSGPPLYYVDQLLIYKQGTRPPGNLYKLKKPITITSGPAIREILPQLQQNNPNLNWNVLQDKNVKDLLSMVSNGKITYTVADSKTFEINRRYMPELRAGIAMSKQQAVVWLLPKDNSDVLLSELLKFWDREIKLGTLAHLNEKYFAHVKIFDYVDTRAFLRAIDTRLPKYRELFKKYADNIDWRKLAATAYQESHWNPDARSPTGVRGLMMLTTPTAKQLGIIDRLDPEQSIKGGAKYLNKILEKLPESIPKNQRMWFALASYNAGYGHVEDARKLAQMMGLNPSAWRDVKQVFPLLQNRKYYEQTLYGYAKGVEVVRYVDNIRRYYATLVWVDNKN